MAESPTQQPHSQLSPSSNAERSIVPVGITINSSDDASITRLLLNYSVLDESFDISVDIHLSRSDDELRMYRDFLIRFLRNSETYEDEAELDAALRNSTDDSGNRGVPPATESAIAALKNIKIESENEAVLCVVCLDMVNVGETAKKLPCGHSYHGDCIVHWLATRNTCPVCRFELLSNDADYVEE